MRIEPTTKIAVTPEMPAECKPGQGVEDFGKMLAEALNDVNSASVEAGRLVNDFAAGKNVDIHQVMLASERASVAMQLTLQVRNKLLEAYQEISRMQI